MGRARARPAVAVVAAVADPDPVRAGGDAGLARRPAGRPARARRPHPQCRGHPGVHRNGAAGVAWTRAAGADARRPDTDLGALDAAIPDRTEEHTSELPSLMRISYDD